MERWGRGPGWFVLENIPQLSVSTILSLIVSKNLRHLKDEYGTKKEKEDIYYLL